MIFGSGTRTPIAITLLVKNPDAKQHGQIYCHDIGDYLSRAEKLANDQQVSQAQPESLRQTAGRTSSQMLTTIG